MSSYNKSWLAVGTPENWHTAFDYGGIWGAEGKSKAVLGSNDGEFRRLIFLCYVPGLGCRWKWNFEDQTTSAKSSMA